MTIISTHRSHTYKASASIHRRDISPKKINSQKNILAKKHTDKYNTTMHNMPHMNNDADVAQILPMLLASIGDYVSGFQYKVLMPTDSPCDEECDNAEDMTEDDCEEMWAHYDYLEWLYD